MPSLFMAPKTLQAKGCFGAGGGGRQSCQEISEKCLLFSISCLFFISPDTKHAAHPKFTTTDSGSAQNMEERHSWTMDVGQTPWYPTR